MTAALPVEAALAPLTAALRAGTSAVLEAPPGAGKSTVVPLRLLAEPWAARGRLVLLEPRRLAARAVAARMAQTLDERVGDTVGYRMRQDTKVSRATRLEVVTEGVLTRMLQDDPALEGVSGVIFDEFHERSLQADLGLALTLDARANLHPELRVLVMSATLDGQSVAQLLGDAPVVRVEGRSFAVETRYGERGPPLLPDNATASDNPERRVQGLIRRALVETHEGDLLVFLPGAREIRRVQGGLADSTGPGVRVVPLYGELEGAAQDEALAPAPPGMRKVVLATNIAETSLTLPGVRVVIDSGLARRARFDPATGMGRLETQRISRASAAQRQGRAGRTAPGTCYRAWGEGAQAALAAYTPAEILEADLAGLALELAGWGARDATMLRWLDPPPPAQLASARDLLTRLDALDAQGRITAHGQKMRALPLHPRLAHLVLRGRELGLAALAGEVAALLSERDLARGSQDRDADLRTRLELLRGQGRATDRGTLERARRAARELGRPGPGDGAAPALSEDEALGLLLALAYPDRVGLKRAGEGGRYQLSQGRGAVFPGAQSLARAELIVAVDLDDADREARIRLAVPLSRAVLEEYFAADLRRESEVAWDPKARAVIARRTLRFGALVLEDKPLPQVPPDEALAAMLEGVRQIGIGALPWDADARDLQARIRFAGAAAPAAAWPDVSDEALAARLEDWLKPWLTGVTRAEQLTRVPLAEALRAQLSYDQQRELEALAPSHLGLPTGTRARVDYRDDSAPAVSVRLQEVYGLAETPRLGRLRVPVTFRLLSPAQRPLQVTKDLASFWRGAYAEVRKDMRGRYPRHDWPEDPLNAAPSRGAKRRR
ncbi:MAG: ATP-dependent helicase HrpB [Proteobacteria bacterium]|nr:ATP-dependent helicase HrpB [Pseudomonadota bacterium]